jgi:membrane protease subunit (stomatin/prohibitin family)
MMRDPEFGPVRIRAFGTYAFKITDPATFIKECVSTDPMFEAFEITNQFRNAIVPMITDTIGASQIPILDLVGNYQRMSKLAQERIAPELAKMGVSLTQFFVENISLPPEVEAALDKRSQMGVLGNLDQYAKFQAAEAMRDAAKNPGGMAGAGVGLGAGVAIGQQMGAALAGAAGANPVTSQPLPPPIPLAVTYHVAINGQQAGPFDVATIAAKVRSGEVTRTSLVWKPGMANWVAAEGVAELSGLFQGGPPPLPR